MRHHLTSDEWADALAGGRAANLHLAHCPACRAELAEMQALMADVVAAGPVPEPPPFFWEHLSARVQRAVAETPAPTWWNVLAWRPLAAMAAVVATVAVVLVNQPVRPLDAPAATVASAEMDGEPIIVWSLIENVVAPMPIDTVAEAGWLPAQEVTAAAIEDLTPVERERLVQLLRAELSGLHE